MSRARAGSAGGGGSGWGGAFLGGRPRPRFAGSLGAAAADVDPEADGEVVTGAAMRGTGGAVAPVDFRRVDPWQRQQYEGG